MITGCGKGMVIGMEALRLFQEYMGTGLLMIWFLVSLLYLWLTEKRKHIRIMFLYVPLLLLLVFFNPLVAGVISRLADGEIYYRILWLLPVTPVLAFVAVTFCGKLGGYRKYVGIITAIVLFMLSGSLIYRNPYFQKVENAYHVPQSVVDICDAIEVPGREVMAVFPGELLQYVRQYSNVVCMPYGRDIVVSKWTVQNELYDLMEQESIDAEELAALARKELCAYVILPESKKLTGKMQDQNFEEFARMHGYVIYKDSLVDLYYFLK